MKKIVKRFLILFLCLTLSISFYTRQKVQAVVGVDDALVIGGVTVTTECVAILVGTTLVAGGTYLASNIDSTDIHYIAQGMINTGNSVNDFAIKVANTGQKFLTWTKEGFSNFCSTVQDFFDNGVVIPSTSSSYSSVLLSQVDGLSCTINVGGEIDVFWYTNENYHVGTNNFSGSAPISVRYVLDGNNLLFYVNGSLASTTYMSSSYKGLQLKLSEGSVCVQPTISKDFNPSICPDSLTGANNSPITNGVPLSSDVLGSDGSVVYNPSIDMPYEKDWGSISSDLDISTDTDIPDIDVPSDTVFDKVIDSIKDLTDSIADSIDKVFDIPVGATPSLDFSPLMIATMKFPFCIPWDLFRCVEVFNSGEETFKYEFKEVKYSDTEIIIIPHFTIDFSTIPYVDILRKVFKFIMYISYCVFLICKIRGLIRS
ncbi:hypothetical protein [Clostridium butyricum]